MTNLEWLKTLIGTTEQECIPFKGSTVSGYGQVRGQDKEMHYAHREVWEIINGPIEDGLEVCHKCDTKNCVNPNHLWLGSHSENHIDKARKKRGRNSSVLTTSILNLRAMGYTHQEIADEVGMSRPHITQIINGTRRTYD